MRQPTESWLPTEEQIKNFLQRFENAGYELRSNLFGFRFVGHGLEIDTSRAVEGLFAFVSLEGKRQTGEDAIVALDRFSNENWFSDWTDLILQRAEEMRDSQESVG